MTILHWILMAVTYIILLVVFLAFLRGVSILDDEPDEGEIIREDEFGRRI